MDGSTSRLPSSSVASVVSASLAARRSVNNSAPATPSSNLDPPRPAKEGHEWVWFPAGYWAEREVIETPTKAIKHFKWRKRSGKSSSGRATEDDPEHFWDLTRKTPGRLSLPKSFIAEEGHALLQQRPPFNRNGTSSESGGSSFPLLRTPQAELPSPYLTEEAHVQSLQRSPLSIHMNSQTNSSESGTSLSMSKLTKPPPSSPLTTENGGSGTTPTPIPIPISTSAANLRPSQSRTPVSPLLHLSPTSPDDKKKKSFFAKLLPVPKPVRIFPLYETKFYLPPFRIMLTGEYTVKKMKKIYSDNDVHDYISHAARAHVEPPTHRSQTSTPTPMMSRMVSLLLREEGGGTGKKTWSRSFKLFGKSPWHPQTSTGSEDSATSSLRGVLRGRTPMASPVSDAGAHSPFFV